MVSHLRGVMSVFSNEVFQVKRQTRYEPLLKYRFTVGLPNLGNTCYMNSLLQALTGCQLFMDYTDRCWKHIKVQSQEDYIVLILIKTLQELKNGSEDAIGLCQNLHESLCGLDETTSKGKAFTALNEE